MSNPSYITLFAFKVSLAGSPHATTINAPSSTKARAALFHILDGSHPYTALRARKIGPAHTSKEFRRTAEYRGMPDLKCGQRVQVGDAAGVVVGHNSSANFDVLFEQGTRFAGLTLNVHPTDIHSSAV